MLSFQTIQVKKVIYEPGDMTRYDFIVACDGPDNFTISPTFNFPQRMSRFEIPNFNDLTKWLHKERGSVKNETNDWLNKLAKKYNCNPCTVCAVGMAIRDMKL